MKEPIGNELPAQDNGPVHVSEQSRIIPQEIDDAILAGNFTLAKSLGEKNHLLIEDMNLVAAAVFEDCLLTGSDASLEKAKTILEEFSLSKEDVNERLIFFMSRGFQRLNFYEVFPQYSKYFEITEEMKKEVGKIAIENSRKLGVQYDRTTKVLVNYFRNLLPNI